MSSGNVNVELERSPVGMGLNKVSQWCDHSDFTKSTQYGILTMTQTIPVGAFIIGSKVKVIEAFDGGTNNLVIGKSSGEDEFSDGATIAVGTVATVGDSAEDPMEFIASTTTVYLQIDEGSDWDDVSTGNMYVEVFYLSTAVELTKGHPTRT